jgi:hypothetical protein
MFTIFAYKFIQTIKEMKINKAKEVVRRLLIQYPELRDNDYRLLANVWNIELRRHNVKTTEATAMDFLHMLASGQLTNSESIRRMRAKLQEEEPALRGKAYEKRHKISSNVKNDLGYAV